MKKENDILGGFDAIFESIRPNEGIKVKGVELIDDPNEPREDTKPVEVEQEQEIELDENEENYINEIEKDDDTEDDVEDTKEIEDIDENESSQVVAFFDAIAEQVGWSDVNDEEKPKSVESFVDYIKKSVEESSKPVYASKEIEELDIFVKNGGDIKEYFETVGDIDYDTIDLTDDENQKYIVREFLREKGFSDVQIKKKIEKYEDADLLQDEAIDAIEFLKESKEENKKALLESQILAHETAVKEQQNFYNGVVEEIEALTDVRGIKIPKEDKVKLMEYIFKTGSDGRTQYQKDYAKSNKNLIESAYFTWKGDALLERAKKSGETSATERLKNTLRTNKVGGSKQTINNGSPKPLWTIASTQLLRRP